MNFKHDVIIVGSGLAGLRAALECVREVDVAVVSKVFPTRSHSGAAQGGITAALGNEEEDHWEWHLFDTVKGSDYLGDQDAIEIMVRDAPGSSMNWNIWGSPSLVQRRERLPNETLEVIPVILVRGQSKEYVMQLTGQGGLFWIPFTSNVFETRLNSIQRIMFSP